MSTLNDDLTKVLKDSGADLVAFADMAGVPGCGLRYAVSVAVAVTPQIVIDIHDGPTAEYYDEYKRLNALLADIVTAGEVFLTGSGFRAQKNLPTVGTAREGERAPLPHKTVATRAGLGWIGRCALLVTPKYGSGVRLSSLLTDAELECGAPVDESGCGDCAECVAACPGDAVTGKLWDVTVDLDAIFSAEKCQKSARAQTLARFGQEVTICGKCIEVCPFTRAYIFGRK